jgi:hypothetical protein
VRNMPQPLSRSGGCMLIQRRSSSARMSSTRSQPLTVLPVMERSKFVRGDDFGRSGSFAPSW